MRLHDRNSTALLDQYNALASIIQIIIVLWGNFKTSTY